MPRINDLRQIVFDIDKLPIPRIQNEDINILWYTRYWDGPLSGIIKYNNRLCHADLLIEQDCCRERYYFVIELTQEEANLEAEIHNEFETKVSKQGHPDVNKAFYENPLIVKYRSYLDKNYISKDIIGFFKGWSDGPQD